MKTIRFLLSIAVLLALCAGYFASQVSYFSTGADGRNRAADWAKTIDTPATVWIALFVLIAAMALSLVRDREGSS